MLKMGLLKRKLSVGFIGILLLSLVLLGPLQASAASHIIPIGPGGASDIGYSFTTTETVSRSQLVTFLDQVKRAEKDANILNNIRFGIASALVLNPIVKKLGASMTAGAASGFISSLIINKSLGSKKIQDVLNKSTAKKFKITIKYTQGNRGQDKWYQASTITVKAA